MFIGKEKACLLAWKKCVYWHGEDVIIGMEEVCLLAWGRCAYWLG